MNIFKKEPNIKFLNKRFYAFGLSLLIILTGLGVYLTKGFAVGIDFSGGTLLEVSFRDPMNVSKIRAILAGQGMTNAQITQVVRENKFFIKTVSVSGNNIKDDSIEDHEVIARKIKSALMTAEEKTSTQRELLDLNTNAEGEIELFLRSRAVAPEEAREASRLINQVKKNETGLIRSYDELAKAGVKQNTLKQIRETTYLGNFAVLKTEIVGPQVGKMLQEKVTWACIWALLSILVYIGFRFKAILYGLSGVLTLFHDVLVCLSFVLFFRIEMSLQVVAGLLTIVGFSINDTIVVFERLWENLRSMRKENLEVILDKTLNQTLSRTVITSLTVFLTVLSLFIFGGEAIRSFAFVMLVGVIAGSYSTIYQSCAWLKTWEKSLLRRKKS